MGRTPRRRKDAATAAALRTAADGLAAIAGTVEVIREARGDGLLTTAIRQIELARDTLLLAAAEGA